MKVYDCCYYCSCLGIKDSCPCYNQDLKDIINDFVCDFYIPNYTKIVDDVRADEREKVLEMVEEIKSHNFYCLEDMCNNSHKEAGCAECALEYVIKRLKGQKKVKGINIYGKRKW